jgi:hypothetical protein
MATQRKNEHVSEKEPRAAMLVRFFALKDFTTHWCFFYGGWKPVLFSEISTISSGSGSGSGSSSSSSFGYLQL